MKKIYFLVGALLLALVFGGCEDTEETSDIAEDYGELTDSDSLGLSGKLEITSDKLTKEVEDVYLISADIVVPDASGIGVYSLSEIEIDDAFVNDAAKTIFDDGEYEEIILQDVDTDELLEAVSSEEDASMVDFYIYVLALDNAEYTADYLYEGKINGIRALAGFEKNTDENGGLMFFITDRDLNESYMVKSKEWVSWLNIEDDIECTYTEEEAQLLAYEYVSKLGLGDYGLMRCDYKVLSSGDESEEFYTPVGYVFYYGIEKNGVTTLYKDDLTDYDIVCESQYRVSAGQIAVCVDSSGVSFFEAVCPYYISGTDTDNSNLLTLEQIVDAFDGIIVDEYGYYEFSSAVEINRISLGYYITEDENQDTVMLPAWAFFCDLDYYTNVYKYLNAINGQELAESN